MTETAPLIRTLHRINRQKADLKTQLARGPIAIAAAKTRLETTEKQVQSLKQKLTESKMEADRKQLQMREREAKITNWEGKLNSAKGNREYQAVKDQIAADQQANEVLSDEILEILESIDEQNNQLDEAQRRVADMQAEFEQIEQRTGDRKGVLEADLARVEQELAEAEAELTGPMKREYERLVAAKGEDAMAAVEENCCGGCYQSLTPQLIDRLNMGHTCPCPACGRLIYHPD